MVGCLSFCGDYIFRWKTSRNWSTLATIMKKTRLLSRLLSRRSWRSSLPPGSAIVKLDATVMGKALDRAYDKAVDGVPGIPGLEAAEELAKDYLNDPRSIGTG